MSVLTPVWAVTATFGVSAPESHVPGIVLFNDLTRMGKGACNGHGQQEIGSQGISDSSGSAGNGNSPVECGGSCSTVPCPAAPKIFPQRTPLQAQALAGQDKARQGWSSGSGAPDTARRCLPRRDPDCGTRPQAGTTRSKSSH